MTDEEKRLDPGDESFLTKPVNPSYLFNEDTGRPNLEGSASPESSEFDSAIESNLDSEHSLELSATKSNLDSKCKAFQIAFTSQAPKSETEDENYYDALDEAQTSVSSLTVSVGTSTESSILIKSPPSKRFAISNLLHVSVLDQKIVDVSDKEALPLCGPAHIEGGVPAMPDSQKKSSLDDDDQEQTDKCTSFQISKMASSVTNETKVDDDTESDPDFDEITETGVMFPTLNNDEKMVSPEVKDSKKDNSESLNEKVNLHLEVLDEDGGEVPVISNYQPSVGASHPLSDLPVVGHPVYYGGREFSDYGSDDTIPNTTSNVSSFQAPLGKSFSLKSMNFKSGIIPVPTKLVKKTCSEFRDLHAVQEIHISDGPLFKASFSPDGSMLAAAGGDGRVFIWRLLTEDAAAIATAEDDQSFQGRHKGQLGARKGEILESEPVQILFGHEAAVLDLCWSRNNFLLTASMDKTVRLWHHSRSDCLGSFKHPDFVTSVSFHPRDDRVFLTGGLDCRVRLWSIVERRVLDWKGLPPGNYFTAVSFSATGRLALAGTNGGILVMFEVPGGSSLEYSSQIQVRSRRGKNSIGQKVCGIRPMPGAMSNGEEILVSTNDSRIRVYALREKSIICKFAGHRNDSSQIAACVSDDGEYVISGSEDGRIYLWNVENRFQKRSLFDRSAKTHHLACEVFDNIPFGVLTSSPDPAPLMVGTNKAMNSGKTVTSAIFAPSSVRNRLQSVGLRPSLHTLPSMSRVSVITSTSGDASAEMSAGQIIVAVDQGGRLVIYENNPLLNDWISSSSS